MNSTTINDRASVAKKCAGYTAQDDRDDFNFIFVHKELDDFGLDPYSFRIYSRIVRRAGKGEAFESNKHMAEGCRMSLAQTKRSLKTLTDHGLVIKEQRPGTTCIYRVAPRRNWSEPIPPTKPSSTDGSTRPTRNGQILDDSENTNNVRIALPELGGGSTRATHLALPDPPLSNSPIKSIPLNLSRGETEENEIDQENKDLDQDKAVIDNRLAANNSQDSATNDEILGKDPLCGAAKIDLQKHFTFSDDPVKEPDFLAYYRSYQKAQGKEIKSVAPYVTAVLNRRDEGSHEVNYLYTEWQIACRSSQRKINNFADNPEEVKRRRERYDFPNWKAETHEVYLQRLMSEGLSRFCSHEISKRWYEWAIAKHPQRFVDIPA